MTTSTHAQLVSKDTKLVALNDMRAAADAQGLAYILFKHKAPHPLYGPNCLLHTLFFSDNSFLFFEGGKSQRASFEDTWTFVLEETQAAHLSVDVAEDNGLIEANTGITLLPWDNHHTTPFEDSVNVFHNADDPIFDGDTDTRLWSDNDVVEAETLLKKIFYALAKDSRATLEVLFESFDYGDGIIINEAHNIDPDLFAKIAELMIDKEPFSGHVLIPSEGDGERWSHYHGNPMVTDFWFEMDANAHHVLKTRAWLSETINTDPRFETVKDLYNAAHKD